MWAQGFGVSRCEVVYGAVRCAAGILVQSLRGGILMPNIQELRSVVGELMQVPADSITGATTLNGVLATSLGRARLDAALRSRFNFANQGVYTLKTFGELCQLSGVAITDGDGSSPAMLR